MQNCADDVPFIGPKTCVDLWIGWGVPKERCIVVKPGDVVKVKDIEIHAHDAFRPPGTDHPACRSKSGWRTARRHGRSRGELSVQNPRRYPVSGGDSHYSNYYAKHGNEHQIDVALGSYGENPRGITDKMTSADILRMGEALNAKVVIVPPRYLVKLPGRSARDPRAVGDEKRSPEVWLQAVYLAGRRQIYLAAG